MPRFVTRLLSTFLCLFRQDNGFGIIIYFAVDNKDCIHHLFLQLSVFGSKTDFFLFDMLKCFLALSKLRTKVRKFYLSARINLCKNLIYSDIYWETYARLLQESICYVLTRLLSWGHLTFIFNVTSLIKQYNFAHSSGKNFKSRTSLIENRLNGQIL